MEDNKNIETQTINKPISLILEESKKAIVDVINSVSLHPALLQMIVKDLYNEISQQASEQYKYEKAEYIKLLNKESIEK